MPRPIKIGNKWKTNIDVPCNGVNCPREKPLPHKHRRRITCATKDEAEAKTSAFQLARKQLREGTTKGEMAWEAFKFRFLIYSRAKAAQTHDRDKLAIRYLERFYPISQLKQITPELLTCLKQKLIDWGKRAWNINRVLSALKAMMRFAEDSKFVEPQTWRLTRMIPTPKGRLHYWETGEIKAIYERCNGIWETIARLAIEAGLRREEIHTLKVENVDFKRNRIHIVGDEHWIPKDFERRWIPMKPTLSEYLKKAINGSEYVLGDKRPSLGVMSSYFRKLISKAGLRGSLHTGRHTYGSHLVMKVPLSVIQKRMGHASIKTTEIYTHLSVDKTDEVYEA